MSLSQEQKKDLNKLGDYFRKIEKIAIENKIDLDVFMTDYSEEGFEVYATEKVNISEVASDRKMVFEKSDKTKASKSTSKSL